MKIITWWKSLKWEDKSYDEVKEGTLFTRKKKLSLRELFLRDRTAVICNIIIPIFVLSVLIIKISQK